MGELDAAAWIMVNVSKGSGEEHTLEREMSLAPAGAEGSWGVANTEWTALGMFSFVVYFYFSLSLLKQARQRGCACVQPTVE